MPDIPGSVGTTSTITVGGSLSDQLEVVGDHDWVRIDLTAGQKITITLDGLTLVDPYLYLRDDSGTLITENDDVNPGLVRDSQIVFTAPSTGTFYIDVAAWVPKPTDPEYPGFTGTYQLTVNAYAPPTVWTYSQIANQLTSGYWGGDVHHFNVTQGGTITVNLTGLTGASVGLAREALNLWSDVIGVTFSEVTTGGQITFGNNESGAFTSDIYSGGFTTSAHVNVSTQWVTQYGSALNTYSFQTFIHEIGHALGLGHAGMYNNTAEYADDALYLNDSWPTTVMSYFGQTENSYFQGQGFTQNYVNTPMLADIRAMATLYGLSTTTRVEDTVYGFGNNSGRVEYDASVGAPRVGYTIFDSGGIDTLNYSGFASNQTINLNPETFSNIGGGVGNLTIAFNTVIENAIGGSGDDVIIANGANNVLSGGSNSIGDTISYEAATSAVTVNLGLTTAQNTGGSGTDTLSEFEILFGSSFNDTLTGGVGSTDVRGRDGNDTLIASADGDRLFGDDGDDTFFGGPGSDTIFGGNGFDTVDYSSAPLGVNTMGGSIDGDGGDWLSDIERQIGSSFNDTLYGNASAGVDALIGGGGDDTLIGGYAGDTLTGGSGNDTFYGSAGELNGDTITDFAVGDKIVIWDANLAAFSYNLTGNTLTFTGGSLTLSGVAGASIVTQAAAGGGVQLTLNAGFAGFGPGDLALAAFGYGASAGGWQSDDRYPRTMADVNGDGRADVIGFGEAGVYVALANASGGYAPSFLARTEFGAGASAGGWISDDRYPRMMADVNGDHRADVVGFGENGVFVALGNGDGSFAPSTLAVAQWGAAGSAGGWSSNDRFLRTMADVNGDGRADIVGFGASAVYVSLANANGTFAPAKIASSGDFDSWVSDDRWPRELIDVNGDHRADIVGFGFDGVHVALANADGTFAPAILASHEFGSGAAAGGWSSNELFHREVGDVNGDGFGDIVGFGANGVYVALGNGNGTFAASHLDISAFGYSPSSGGWASQDHFPRHIADVNGDGAADILGFGNAGVYVAYSHGGI